MEAAHQTFYLTQSQYTDTGPTRPSADPITPGTWQGSHGSANLYATGMTRPVAKCRRKRDSNPGSSALEADALTTRPSRRSTEEGNFSTQRQFLRSCVRSEQVPVRPAPARHGLDGRLQAAEDGQGRLLVHSPPAPAHSDGARGQLAHHLVAHQQPLL